jgi:hypothetical protein
MPSQSQMLQSLAGKLHTIHPAFVLAPLAIATWVAVPALIIGESSTPARAAQSQNEAVTARGALPGNNIPAPSSSVTSAAPFIAPASPRPIVVPGLGGMSGRGSAGSNLGGRGTPPSSSAAGNSTQRGQPSLHAHLPPAPDNIPGSPPLHTGPRGVPQPLSPTPKPSVLTPPGPPRVAVPPTPPIAHPPVIVVPPLRMQPFAFGRPMVARPFVGGGGFVRRR